MVKYIDDVIFVSEKKILRKHETLLWNILSKSDSMHNCFHVSIL